MITKGLFSSHKSIFTFFFVLFLVAGCASTTSYKTAESLNKGDIVVGVGGSTISVFPDISGAAAIEPYARYGVTDSLDVELKYLLGPIASAKYSFEKNAVEKTQNAVEFGLAHIDIGFFEDAKATDVYTSILHTRQFGKLGSITMGPKLILRTTSNDDFIYILGAFANYELKLGDHWSVIPETALHISPQDSDKTVLLTVGGGLNYTF